ncbi:MAG: hypothetical protein JST38_13425 [Bacteroidetes bacterium]|nr:hypothetical protein [Bacteroidota bacterium]
MPAGPATRKERTAFLVLSVLVFTYITARAVFVPFIGDEARTFFYYNEPGRFQPWYAYWDAANHLLSTALAQVCYPCFGPAAWSLRLPSVLAFLLYAWYTWRFGRLLEHRSVRWPLLVAMLFTPMLIEFFSLYRGYGLGIAFLLMGLFHLVRAAATGKAVHFVGALTGFLLAAYASFSLVILWASALVFLAILVVHWRKSARSRFLAFAAIALLGLLPLTYLGLYSRELAKRGALYYGSADGLVQGTLPSVIRPMFPNLGWDPAPSVAVLGLLLIMLAFANPMKSGWKRLCAPVSVIAMLLLPEVIGRYVLNGMFDVLFPVDRAALHLVTLMVLLFVFTLDALPKRLATLRYTAVVLLIFPITTARQTNLDHVGLWPDDPITEEVFQAAAAYQNRSPRPLSIGSTEFLRYSWALRNMAHHVQLPLLQNVPEGCTGTDLLLLHTADTATAPAYHRVAGKPTDAVVLCARNAPLPLHLIHDSIIPPNATVPDSWMLWEPAETSPGCAELLIELEAVITSPAPPLEALVVWETSAKDSPYAYSDLAIAMQREAWNGDTLRLARWIPLPGTLHKRVDMRIWNIRKQPMAVGYCRVRAYCLAKDADIADP